MEQFFLDHKWIIILVVLWSFPWKAAALWRSARRGHIGWFLTLFILNTLAILDILYIFIFSGWGRETKEHQESIQQNKVPREYYPRESKLSSDPRNRGGIL